MSEQSRTTPLAGGPLGPATPILAVRDLTASLEFYAKALGFSLDWRDGAVASVSRDRASIMLVEGDQGLAGTWLWIACADVDALYAAAAEQGAVLRSPPANYPWGSRECQIEDPDGHVLRFGADVRAGEPIGAWLDGAGVRWLPTPDGGWAREP